MKHAIFLLLCLLVFVTTASAQNNPPKTSPGGDKMEANRQELIDLENSWLKSEHQRADLERILAPDFVHPVITGDFLTKEQHIDYSTRHPPPANLHHRFEKLMVRVYGNVGIVNGIVVTSDENSKDVDHTIFTDVFVYREGRWQAVNAQENKVEKLQKPQ